MRELAIVRPDTYSHMPTWPVHQMHLAKHQLLNISLKATVGGKATVGARSNSGQIFRLGPNIAFDEDHLMSFYIDET